METLNDLVKDLSGIHFCKEGLDNYAIRVLGRGENLFFQKNEKAYLIEIDAGNGFINSKNIQNLNSSKKISKVEKEELLKMVVYLYQKFYNDDANTIYC